MESVPQPGRYPLVVDPIIGTKWLTKVLLDGSSGLNIMYPETLDAMGIYRSCIRPTRVPFHGIVPRKQAVPLGQIDLPITFGGPSNYRTKTLTFLSGWVPRNLPCHPRMTMLRKVQGHHQLHLPKAKDVGPRRGHHHQHLARLQVRGRVL